MNNRKWLIARDSDAPEYIPLCGVIACVFHKNALAIVLDRVRSDFWVHLGPVGWGRYQITEHFQGVPVNADTSEYNYVLVEVRYEFDTERPDIVYYIPGTLRPRMVKVR